MTSDPHQEDPTPVRLDGRFDAGTDQEAHGRLLAAPGRWRKAACSGISLWTDPMQPCLTDSWQAVGNVQLRSPDSLVVEVRNG